MLGAPLQGLNYSYCHRQHHCCCLHKQRGGYEIRLSLCPSLEIPVMVQHGHYAVGSSYSGQVERDIGQAIPSQPSYPDGMVSPAGDIRPDLPLMAHNPNEPVSHQVQLENSLFMSPVPDKEAWAVDTLSISWDDMEGYAFPPTSQIVNVINKILSHNCRRIIVIAPDWPYMSWFWDLVNLSTQIPLCLPYQPNLLTQLFNRSLCSDLLNLNLHAWFLEP